MEKRRYLYELFNTSDGSYSYYLCFVFEPFTRKDQNCQNNIHYRGTSSSNNTSYCKLWCAILWRISTFSTESHNCSRFANSDNWYCTEHFPPSHYLCIWKCTEAHDNCTWIYSIIRNIYLSLRSKKSIRSLCLLDANGNSINNSYASIR